MKQNDIKMKAGNQEKNSEAEFSEKKNKETSSQLYERSWSVINFEASLASGLTYDEAVKVLEKHAKENVSGLCIITDEAAKRIDKKQ